MLEKRARPAYIRYFCTLASTCGINYTRTRHEQLQTLFVELHSSRR